MPSNQPHGHQPLLCLLNAGHRMGRTQHAGSAQETVPVTPHMLILSLCFKGRAARGWNSLTPKWALEPSATPPWSLTLDFSSSSKMTFLDRGGGWGKMASSGSLGSDFTIPRVDGWWEGCQKGPGPGAGGVTGTWPGKRRKDGGGQSFSGMLALDFGGPRPAPDPSH